jgi:hypothetical protein
MNQKKRDELAKACEDFYGIKLKDIHPISDKCFMLTPETEEKNYLLKEVPPYAKQKYEYLSGEAISNVIYPIFNEHRTYCSTCSNGNSFYLREYYDKNEMIPEVAFQSMFQELETLHQRTVVKKRLSQEKARPKMEEMTKRLNYEFIEMEQFVRSVESMPIGFYSMAILANYQYLLDAKKEMVYLQKRIITKIKDRESIDYVFLHNRPDLDHLINIKGSKYLLSLENGHHGIGSLDFAKLYFANEDLDIDYASLFKTYFQSLDSDFYFDYFRYLVLFFIIRRIHLTSDIASNANLFIVSEKSIKKYFARFKENSSKEESRKDS